MRPHRFPLPSTVDAVILVSVAASFAVLVPDTIRNAEIASAALRGRFDGEVAASLLGAALLYVAAHLLRAIRLYLILGIGRIRFTPLLGYHAAVALGTLATPFKLGELARALELFRLLGNDPRGLFAVWADRLLDVGFVLVAILGLMAVGQRQSSLMTILSAALAFLALSGVVLLLLPAALKGFARSLLASNSRRSLLLLRSCASAQRLLSYFPRLDGSTLALLAVVTLAVWVLELLVIVLVLSALPQPETGDPLLAGAADIFVSVLLVPLPDPAPHVALYRLVSVLSLVAIVGVTAHRYLRARRQAGGWSFTRLRRSYRWQGAPLPALAGRAQATKGRLR